VIASTIGFLILLLLNATIVARLVVAAESPEFPHWLDQRFLVLATWGFPVIAVWGFNARWLPAFLGLKPTSGGGLLAGLGWCGLGVTAALFGNFHVASAFLIIASIAVPLALNIFEPAQKPPQLQGVHPAFPVFVRLCYVWLFMASLLGAWASRADQNGGIWGASRHALTVGFLAGMIFAIGPRILPVCGGRQLFSPRLMFAACSLLNVGCLLRVSSGIPAYEGFAQGAWRVVPYSAVIELMAVCMFALNLALTMAHRATPARDSRFYTISFAEGPKQI
jgi:hypothetical protein